MPTVPLKLYELFEEKLGKEKAKEAIELVERALKEVEKKAEEQKIIVKAQIREELRKELVTKEEFYGEVGKLEQKIETVRQEIETVKQEIEAVRQELKGDIKKLEGEIKGEIRVLKILVYVTILTVIFMNRGTVDYLVHLVRMMK